MNLPKFLRHRQIVLATGVSPNRALERDLPLYRAMGLLAAPGPASGSHIQTENGDNLTTESGDKLIIE